MREIFKDLSILTLAMTAQEQEEALRGMSYAHVGRILTLLCRSDEQVNLVTSETELHRRYANELTGVHSRTPYAGTEQDIVRLYDNYGTPRTR